MTQPLNGLSILQDRRQQQASRGAPPPRHPRPNPTADNDAAADRQEPTTPGTTDEAPIVEATNRPAPGDSKPRQATGSPPEQQRARSSGKASPQKQPVSAAAGLRAAQFYVDDRCDDYLSEVRIEAIRRRADVSGSAVVRFALHRLIEELSPAQIADRLAVPAAESSGSGRKRH
jgi:hypothetical protein